MGKIPRRVLVPILLVIAVVGALLATRGRAVPVSVASASRDSLSVVIGVEGRTRARDLYTVAAPVSGLLERLKVQEGSSVEAGEILGRLFPAEQDSPALATLRADLQGARAGALQAESAVREASLQAEQAAREVERRRPLAEMGALSAEAMEQVELAAIVAGRRLEAAEAALASAEAAVDGAEARLLGAEGGTDPRSAITLTAPVSGRVLHIAIESERVVAAGTPLLELANTGGLEVVLDVLSEDAVRVLPGQPLRITGWGGDGVLTGRIRNATLAGYTKVSALGVEEQRVDVLADLDHIPPTLGSGYRVSGDIVLEQGSEVLQVPTSALFRVDAAWRLFAVEDGRARSRTVTIGRRNDEAVEILEGVAEGDVVILFPSELVEDGVRVRPLS